jgi:hypothetical protein
VEYTQFKSIFKQAQHISEVWTALNKRWEQSTLASKLLVCERLYSLEKPNSETLLAFLTRCTNIYCELEAAGFLNEGMIVYKVLKVLKADSRYTTWVDIVRARGQLPTFHDLADEAREFFAAEIVQEQNHVFSVEGALRADEISEKRTQSDACYYCGYRGHEKKDCRFFKRDSEKGELKPQGWYKTNHFQRIRNKPKHFKQKPEGRYAGALITSEALRTQTFQHNGFIIDSRASQHMVNKSELLLNIRPTDIWVKTAGDQELHCTAKGEAVILTATGQEVLLQEVLLLPAMTCNLLSVPKAIENGLKVDFQDNGQVLFTQSNSSVLLRGQASGSLFELAGYAIVQQTIAAQADTKCQMDVPSTSAGRNGILWHRRLGHIGFTSLAKMASKKRVKGLPSLEVFARPSPCWACASGKLPRGPFPLSTNATCRPLELLHTDIAGPMQVASAGGAKYFVTMLDDFTKFKTVKPLKKRSEAPGFIKHIVANWEAATGQKTLAIRNDRGKEFLTDTLQKWYDENIKLLCQHRI